MTNAPNKTQPTATDVAEFIATVPDPDRRADAETLTALMARLSGEPPRMWGPSIVGFGEYHYRYESGRTGSMARISFSPRKAETVLYLAEAVADAASLARLGKHRTGKSCLYIKSLADIDMAVLETLITKALAAMATRYPPD